MTGLLLPLALILFGQACRPHPDEDRVSGEVVDNERRALYELELEEDDRNFSSLSDMAHEIDTLRPRSADDPATQPAERRDKLRLWLTLLDIIDQHLDASFDPEDAFFWSIAPPISSSGVILDSGISPRWIKDPDVRRRYEEALEKNRLKRERYVFQDKLRAADKAISSMAEAYVGAVYVGKEDDVLELNTYVDRYIENKERCTRLKLIIKGAYRRGDEPRDPGR